MSSRPVPAGAARPTTGNKPNYANFNFQGLTNRRYNNNNDSPGTPQRSRQTANLLASLDKSILQIRDWLALLESMIKKDRADMSDSGHIYHMLERQKVSFLVFFACRFHGIFYGLSEK
jgi:hypothetical protein